MNKDVKQTLKRLTKEGLIVGKVEDRTDKHLKVILSNGARYVVASSASDHRAHLNVEMGIRRLIRQGG